MKLETALSHKEKLVQILKKCQIEIFSMQEKLKQNWDENFIQKLHEESTQITRQNGELDRKILELKEGLEVDNEILKSVQQQIYVKNDQI